MSKSTSPKCFPSAAAVPTDGADAITSFLRADADADFASEEPQQHHVVRTEPPVLIPSASSDSSVDDARINPRTDIDIDDDDEDEIMPNLAKLVAASIRDRVVLEQMEEIAALRAQLNASHRVEITGPNGFPVFARGNFSKGDFNTASLASIEDGDDAEDETGLYWDVGLKMVQQQSQSQSDADADGDGEDCKTTPLNKLSNIEIRIGGVLYVSSSEVEGTRMAFGIRPGNKFDARNGELDMTRSAVAEFNTEDATGSATGSRSSLLTFHIRDFPRGHWRSLQSVAMLNRSIALRQQEREEQRDERREMREVERRERIAEGEYDAGDESDYESEEDDDEEDQEPLDVYNYLTHCLSKRHPGQRADITSVSFCIKSARGRIESLNRRGEEFQNTKEKFFRKIDEMYQDEADGMESLEEEHFDT